MSPSDDIEVRLVRPDEGRLLTELIRRCYGETYIDPSFYGRAFLRRRLHRSVRARGPAFTHLKRLDEENSLGKSELLISSR